MDVNKIIGILNENYLTEVEELKNEDGVILLKFYLDFDEVILNAARSYANEESDYEAESPEWFREYYIPYLYEYGNDEVLDIVEEIIEEFEISGEVMAFQMDLSNYESMQFMALFTENDDDIVIEDIAKDFII